MCCGYTARRDDGSQPRCYAGSISRGTCSPSESTPADTIQKLRKFDACGLRCLGQQTGRSHARQRVRFQAPEPAGIVAAKVGAAISAEFQHMMHAPRVILKQGGLRTAE